MASFQSIGYVKHINTLRNTPMVPRWGSARLMSDSTGQRAGSQELHPVGKQLKNHQKYSTFSLSKDRRHLQGPNVDLIGAMETQSEPSELELDDVVITNPHIEAILENEDWIEDASGLVSHCISILKICHTLTEKLVAMTMGSGAKVKAPASLSDIITVAKRISPRVDDVVRSMYPPLDPILLDARATALLLSVSHLVLVTRNACHMSGSMDWIDQSLHAAEDHMVVLREAALASEPDRSLPGIDMQREQAI
ncbi:transmembrane protein 98 isoform X1 [Hypomesus transpacificus]|uniref:transmembrane protein 98 isoform X1 n=1 Tax=Hypomesus transpacificus TaxID=137520 RepID=UPI001F085409|nr:transmembrane protein 98 isoform X1 [Hypomesus transpacificus]